MRPRPIDLLESVSRQYPHAWTMYGHAISERGKSAPDWPTWCHCPSIVASAVVDAAARGASRADIPKLAALAAWRATQGIYRYGNELRESLIQTPLTGDIPSEHLERLPEWCVYVEMPLPPEGIHGFFAHLDYNPITSSRTMRLLLDTEFGLAPISLQLDTTIEDAIDWTLKSTATDVDRKRIADAVTPCMSLLLYLCSDDAELRRTRGSTPRGKTHSLHLTRKGPRERQASRLEIHEVGFTISAFLRDAAGDGPHSGSKRGHVRRAHWHSYWHGPKSNPQRKLQWLSPIAVKLEGVPNVATVRYVIEDD